MRELPAAEAKALMEGCGGQVIFLDVREPWEVRMAAVAEALNIPMGDIPHRLEDLRRDCPVVVMCHHGGRSRQVAHFLERAGFDDVINLAGGIDAWSREVDPGVPQY